MAKEIILTQNKITIVDDEDFERLNKFKWHAHSTPHIFYAARTFNNKMIYMHRYIMKTEGKLQVDHINGNPLDNRKSNLRIVTQKQNTRNSKMKNTNTSGYKGVYWYKRSKKWCTHIHVDGKTINLGYFDDKNDAAKVYNEAAIKYFGEFAKLNIIKK